jgi:molybdopterin-guanine dinucleotide biosynthesis protein A
VSPATEREGGVTAIVLSGGRGRRFDHRDKGLLSWRGKPLISHVIDRISPQVDELVICSNRNEEAYRALGYEILPDDDPDYQGPVAGMLAGLGRCTTLYALVCPCDSPNLPADLVDRLWAGIADGDADIAVVHDGTRRQNLVALMKTGVRESLLDYYRKGGRAVHKWYSSQLVADIDFSGQADNFLNINRPEDLAD